jgi:hypothetical protein
MPKILWLGVAAAALCASGLARAQDAAARPDPIRYPPLVTPPSTPRTWGTSHESFQRIGAMMFVPVASTEAYDFLSAPGYQIYSTVPGNAAFIAHPVLPSGALVTGVDFDVCDTSPSQEVQLQVLADNATGTGLQVLNSGQTTGTPGCAPVFVDLSASNFVVDNAANTLMVDIILTTGDTTQSYAGATVHYILQVSAPPGTATFGDVPTGHPFFQYVEALNASGITAGCGNGNFCPDAPLTRGQMAVFLSKALGLQWP